MRRRRALAMAATAMLAACGRSGESGELGSCQRSLTGTWQRDVNHGPVIDRVTSLAHRWAILDHKSRVEIYPLFDDTADTAAEDARAQVVRSPRSAELLRSRRSLLGHVERWVMKAGEKCVLRGSARISSCASDERGEYLEIQLAPLPTPATDEELAACLSSPRAAPSRAERWRRAD